MELTVGCELDRAAVMGVVTAELPLIDPTDVERSRAPPLFLPVPSGIEEITETPDLFD